jgi:hypothetical protein
MNSVSLALPKPEINAYILEQIPIKAGFAHTEEVAWLLFWARDIGLSVPSDLLAKVSALRSSVAALLTLDLIQIGLVSGPPLDTSLWESFATTDGLKTEMWLLVYEATKKGWWPKPNPSNFIEEAAFFQDIWAKNVEFYDPKKRARRRISPVFTAPRPIDDFGGGGSAAGYPD